MDQLIPANDSYDVKRHLNSSQIISSSYQLYQGSTGFQDYGIVGYKIKQNIIDAWRRIFIGQDNDIYEVETPLITPYNILKTSGHIDNFTDYVIYNKEGKCYRADHLVKNHELFNGNVDEMKPEQLEEYIKHNNLIDCDAETHVVTKNLMLEVGSSDNKRFLRPEIAQGIFINMKQYIDHFSGKLPFGIAQVGKSFRHEVSPQPFIRLREFTQAEIEYIYDPSIGKHKLFSDVQNHIIPLFSSEDQITRDQLKLIRICDAVEDGIICNQIMGYFLGKIYEFANFIGLNIFKIRFRQHLKNEMAHYAIQCWDLECLVDNSWLECAGCAHRGSHDLTAHNIGNVFNIKRNNYSIQLEKNINIKEIKGTNIDVQGVLQDIKNNVNVDEIILKYNIPREHIIVKEIKIWESFIPNVIEPSIGIDRICYALLSHNLYKRKGDISRLVLRLNKQIAPYNVAIFQLSSKPELNQIVQDIVKKLSREGFKCYIEDSSISIGKKYVRADEIGINDCVTVDFKTLNDNSVTIRSRDNMQQIRIEVNKLPLILKNKFNV